MFRFLPALILLASLRPAYALSGAELGDEIQNTALDPSECYRVLDLNFSKEDVKIYLASGYLVFTKPVFTNSNQGTRLGAVFVVTAEAGDADVLLLPPTRSERSSLATFTPLAQSGGALQVDGLRLHRRNRRPASRAAPK